MTRNTQPDMEEKTSAPASPVWTVAKWCVMAIALFYLWREGMLSHERLRLSARAWWGIPAALLCLVGMTMCMSVRFHALFRGLGSPSSLGGQVKLNFSALLAQQAGSEAGYDVARVFGARAMGAKGADIFAAVLLDRLLGTIALAGITMAGVAIYWTGGSRTPLLAAGAAMLLAVPVLYWGLHWLERRDPETSRVWRLPGSRFVASVGTSVLRFKGQYGMLAALLVVSLAGHAFFFAAVYCCGLSLAECTISPSEALLGGALSSFTGALPLPLAGLGVGEVAFGTVVSGMRGGGELVEFAAVFLINRMLLLILGVASWAWVTLSKKRLRDS